MMNLITNYSYDWTYFKEEGIIKKDFKSFLTWFKNSDKMLQLDIETNVVDRLYDREIYVIQIGDKNSYGIQWVFDIPRMDEKDILLLKSVLYSKKKTWIIHNAAFEYTVLKMVYGIELYDVMDTFLMSKIISNGHTRVPGYHGLAGTLSREFGIELSKEEQTSFTGAPLSRNQVKYAATDVVYMGNVYDAYIKLIKEEGSGLVLDLENKAVRAFGDIQTNGLRLDWDKWLSNAEIFTEELEECEDALNSMLFEPAMYDKCIAANLIQDQDVYHFNWPSIAFKREVLKIVDIDIKPTLANLEQLKIDLENIENPTNEQQAQLTTVKYMFNKQFDSLELHLIMKYDQILIDKEIKVLKDTIIFNWTQQIKRLAALKIEHPLLTSTSEKALNRLSSPIVRKYKEWVKKAKLVSSFGKTFIKYIDADGKVRTSIQQIMATGRISSSNPNLQNLPHVALFRNPFKADDSNYKLTIADYSSQEVLIAATLADEKAWLTAVKKKWDLHSFNASLIFGQEWTDAAINGCVYVSNKEQCECPEHKKLRTFSKTITFGLIYGMGVMKLAETLNIDKKVASELMKKFFSTFPKIDTFMEDTKRDGLVNKVIETAAPFYRKRHFDIPLDEREAASIKRKSGNTVIQGTAADMVKLALHMIKEELDTNPDWDVQIKMQIHDEIICQAPNDKAELWAKKQVEIMELAAEKILGHTLLKSTVIISDQWEK